MSRAPGSVGELLPSLVESLYALTASDLKWRLEGLPGRSLTRKADLVEALRRILMTPEELQRLWEKLTPDQQQVVGEVVHAGAGRYDAEAMAAKYPKAPPPRFTSYSYGYGAKRVVASPFDLLFSQSADFGIYVPPDLAALLRPLAPLPVPIELPGHDDPPVELVAPAARWLGRAPAVWVSEVEQATFHDVTAALQLIHEGKAGVGAATRLPTLATVRQLRQRLLVGDYVDGEYQRADDAMRPLALLLLVQAARWAAPDREGGSKLALTRAGQAVLTASVQAGHLRDAWQAWLKSDLLDELSRVKALRGQGAKATRLTKPVERRAKIAAALRACPPQRWVTLHDFFRYARAEHLSPTIERTPYSNLYVSSYPEYGTLNSVGDAYWDVVIGSYVRVVLWEYAATLGLIEIAYAEPEAGLIDLNDLYGMEDEPYLSRYDGLLGLRLTSLGAYVLGLTDEYVPPTPSRGPERPVLTLLPNLDIVVTDARRLTPNDRAFLERIGAPRSQDVYRLSQDSLLDLIDGGFSLAAIRRWLAERGGLDEAAFPQPMRVFLDDVERRLGALRDGGRMLLLAGDDPLLLTELAHETTLRGVVQLGAVAGATVLLVPEAQEATVRRHLKRLGYLPSRAGQRP